MKQFQQKQSQSGRSMVEMLGVLAIIGVLSVGAIAGYRYAMNQYIANETINDVLIWAATVRGIPDYQNQAKNAGEYEFSNLGTTTKTGYPIYADIQSEDSAYGLFQIVVENVPNEVCQRIIEMRPEEIRAIRPEAQQGSGWQCLSQNDKNDLLFIFEDPSPCKSLCGDWYKDWLDDCGTSKKNCDRKMGFYCRQNNKTEDASCPSGYKFYCIDNYFDKSGRAIWRVHDGYACQ